MICEVCGKELKYPKSTSHRNSKFHQNALIGTSTRTDKYTETEFDAEQYTKQYSARTTSKSFFKTTEASFVYKVIPSVIIGFIMAAFGCWYYAGLIELNLLAYIGLAVLGIALTIAIAMLSLSKHNLVAFILYVPTTFLIGILQVPTIQWALGEVGFDTAMELFIIASVGGILATIAALAIGAIFHDSIMDIGGQLMYKLTAMFIATIAIEIFLWLIFGITDLVILIVSGLVIIWITGMTILDGAYIYDNRDVAGDNWVYWAYSIFLDVWIYLIRIFVILVVLSKDD